MVTDTEVTELYLESPGSIVPIGSRNKNDKTEIETSPGGWSPLLVLVGITCVFGSAFPTGYYIGCINNPQAIMRAFCNQSISQRYNTTLNETTLNIVWSAVVSILLVGGVSGSLSAGWLADKFGRRGALGIGNLFGILGGVLFMTVQATNSVEILMAGRLVVGVSAGLATSLVPMYSTETAPLKLRGAVGVFCQLGITSGVLFGQIMSVEWTMGVESLWHYMLAAVTPLCIISMGLLFILPESPKYLYVVKGQQGKAVQELCRLRNLPASVLEAEVANLNEEATASRRTESWSLGRVIKDPTVRLPLILVCCMQAGQQLAGINAVFNYSNIIFTGAGLDSTQSQYATLGTGIVNVVMALVGVSIMTHFGRRTLFLWSCYTSAGCLIFFMVALMYINAASIMPILCIIALLAYVMFYGIGLGPIPFFIGSELFDVGPRPAAMSLGSVSNWGGNFIVSMTFPSIQGAIDAYSFLIFATIMVLLSILIRIYLPETRGRDTLEISATMTKGFKSRPNKVADNDP